MPVKVALPDEAKNLLTEHLRHLLAQEASQLTFAAPATVPTAPQPAAEAPWYPDDSGKWVEHDGSPNCPVRPNTMVEVIKYFERQRRCYSGAIARGYQFNWHDTVAYKVVS